MKSNGVMTPADMSTKADSPGSSDERRHEVGYAKPPVATRFKPGQSGNLRGRPKGKRKTPPALSEERLKIIILNEAYRHIKVNDGDRLVSIPMAQAIIRSLAVSAAKGQQRSQRLFTELLTTIEQEHRASFDSYVQTMIHYKVEWEVELNRRSALGIEGPEPVPHPDDIIITFDDRGAIINGPKTKEEKPNWDRLRKRMVACDHEIAEFRKQILDRKNKKYVEFLKQEIEFELSLRAKIAAAIGEPPARFLLADDNKP